MCGNRQDPAEGGSPGRGLPEVARDRPGLHQVLPACSRMVWLIRLVRARAGRPAAATVWPQAGDSGRTAGRRDRAALASGRRRAGSRAGRLRSTLGHGPPRRPPRRRRSRRARRSAGRPGRLPRPDRARPQHGRADTPHARAVTGERAVRVVPRRGRHSRGSAGHDADHGDPGQEQGTLGPRRRPSATVAVPPLRLRRMRAERRPLPGQQRGDDRWRELTAHSRTRRTANARSTSRTQPSWGSAYSDDGAPATGREVRGRRAVPFLGGRHGHGGQLTRTGAAPPPIGCTGTGSAGSGHGWRAIISATRTKPSSARPVAASTIR